VLKEDYPYFAASRCRGTECVPTNIKEYTMKKLLLTSSLALGLATGLFADTITPFASIGGAATGSNLFNFDSLLVGSGSQTAWSTGGTASVAVSFSPPDSGVVNGATKNVFAAPFLSGGNGLGFGSPNQPNGPDTTNYLSTGTGSVTLDFGVSLSYLGLLWGSVDDYNTIEFFDGLNSVGSFTGIDVLGLPNGNQGPGGSVYVNFNDVDGVFTKVVLTSSTNAFEIDNVAINAVGVPDGGATVGLVGLGLIALAAIRRKR
jgi:hypothetical protein